MAVLRIAGLADNQVDENSRLEEHDRVMKYAAAWGRDNGVGLWIHAGDVYDDPDGSTERERASVAEWVTECAEYAPVVVVGGNHEAPGEVAELRRLRTRHGVSATEDPCVLTLGAHGDPRLPVVVQALPWPRKSHLLRWLGAGADPERVRNETGVSMQDLLRGLGRDAARARLAEVAAFVPRPPVVLGAHVSVKGASSDSDQPLIGLDIEVSLVDLALAEPDFGFLGHIHRPQEWIFGGVPFAFCGSPRRTSYASGELIPKGFIVAEFEDGQLLRWWREATPATPMILVEAAWSPGEPPELLGGLGFLQRVVSGGVWKFSDATPSPLVATDIRGAEIRFRYVVDADHAENARRGAEEYAADLVAAGAAEVKLEPRPRPVVRARAPEVAAAATPEEKLRKFLVQAGEEAPRVEALLDKFRQVAEIGGTR